MAIEMNTATSNAVLKREREDAGHRSATLVPHYFAVSFGTDICTQPTLGWGPYGSTVPTPLMLPNTALGSDGQGPKGFSFVFLEFFVCFF